MTKKCNLGKSVINNIKQSKRRHNNYIEQPILTVEKDLSSKIEENDLQKLLSRAILKDIEFEHANFSQYLHDDLNKNANFELTIPKRPKWQKSLNARDFHNLEILKFEEWKKELSKIQENIFNQRIKGNKLCLTPYEKNIEVWRQLWFVLEKSNILIQIVDARNPLFYRNTDLELYNLCLKNDDSNGNGIKVEPKLNVILINKSDFLTKDQMNVWMDALSVGSFPHPRLLSDASLDKGDMPAIEIITKTKLHSLITDCIHQPEFSENCWNSSKTLVAFFCAKPNDKYDSGDYVLSIDDVLELLDILKIHFCQQHMTQLSHEPEGIEPVLNVGFVGYPNVGKSSTINALLGAKKVSVSSTPGKTKHFQTHLLPYDPTTCLCDCPGLIMPNVVENGKAELIINGIISVDTMTDPYGPIELIINQIGEQEIAKFYGLTQDHFARAQEYTAKNRSDNNSRKVLAAHSISRGFSTTLGQPDFHHSARIILKDYNNGDLLYCHPPQGIDTNEFRVLGHQFSSLKHTHLKDQDVDKKRYDVEGDLDRQFFVTNSSVIHNKAILKILNTSNLSLASGPGGPLAGLTVTDMNPAKKHYNKNKHEKIRRINKT